MNYLNQTALYFQVKEAIKRHIENNKLKAGDKLPSEKELMDKFKVSRITIRKALDELERDGLLVKVHGKGSFVSAGRIQTELSYMNSFSEDMKRRGFETFAKVLKNCLIDASEDIREILRLQSNEQILYIKRVRYANQNPIAIEECYLPGMEFSSIVDEDLSKQSLNRIIEEKYDIKFAYAEQIIETMISNNQIMNLLELKKPTAILFMKRTAFDSSGRPVQYTVSYYRGDIYKYKVMLPMANTNGNTILKTTSHLGI